MSISRDDYLMELKELKKSSLSIPEKYVHLGKILERISLDLTREETMQFPNLFSRLVFIATHYKLPKHLEWRLQNLRITARHIKNKKKEGINLSVNLFNHSFSALVDLINLADTDIDVTSVKYVEIENEIPSVDGFSLDRIRVQVISNDEDKKQLLCFNDDVPGIELVVHYGVKPDNNDFESTIILCRKGVQLNLIDCKLNDDGSVIPAMFVFEPDYLVDVSSIAACFYDSYYSSSDYFRSKFEEIENRSYLLLGNLANFFLDELVYSEDPMTLSFHDVFRKSFKQSPIEYTSCRDIQSKMDFDVFMAKAEKQFENIRRVVMYDLPLQNIDPRKSLLEPSFFCEKYGFKGRLDLLYSDSDSYKVVELKSGRLPFPYNDKGKISLGHLVQATIYRLIIEAVFSVDSRSVESIILYSASDNRGENLRFAASYRALEKHILNFRNHIVANEYDISVYGESSVEKQISDIGVESSQLQRVPPFVVERNNEFAKTISASSSLERKYFYRFVSFVAKEIYLQKIGDTYSESYTGASALWNRTFEEREGDLNLFSDLTIEKIEEGLNNMTILFSKRESDSSIVNFREGDICIVYPRYNNDDTPLTNQILKGTIAHIDSKSVEVRFRYKQRNHSFFDNHVTWVIEQDSLDSSSAGMYRNLYSFLRSSTRKRELWLGVTPPHCGNIVEDSNLPETIVDKAMEAEDYFLVVGPPGTGKTSIFARKLIERYYSDNESDILVLAYTNRAVDELCDAVNSAFGCKNGECDKYIRIGTELSCSETYRHRLLQKIAESKNNRRELRDEIQSTRIYISTLASLNGRQELFSFKKFKVAIIDEASQILEPQIIGVLPKVDRVVMIGDHNQLSTIVLQKDSLSSINDPELVDAGFTDCRQSLFERLLRRCIDNGWQGAYARLNKQGRMHVDIAQFPSSFFYDGKLCHAEPCQIEPLSLSSSDIDVSPFTKSITDNRVVFYSTEKLMNSYESNKVNEVEAVIVVKLIVELIKTYKSNSRELNLSSVGIIAPYRNQIALIKSLLEKENIPDFKKIMVDTVERYQGSQRDVIIVSFCVNKSYQLKFLSNTDVDGKVDRKLNVALTRAKEQMFLVGNPILLSSDPIYASLIDYMRDKTVVVSRSWIENP